MQRLPTLEAVLDHVRFTLQIVGGPCGADEYMRLTERVHHIEKLPADTPIHRREQLRQAIHLSRAIIAAAGR